MTRANGEARMAVLNSKDNAVWASLAAAVPAGIANRLDALLNIAGVTGVVQYSADGRPRAFLAGQRRPGAAMMRIALSWTAASVTATERLRLLEALEREAFEQGVLCLRADIALPVGGQWEERDGFRQRWIGVEPTRRQEGVPPLWPQTAGFTCGPSSLAMAMAGVDPSLRPGRALEVELWREATTIIGPNGPGGCDPFGLALAAHRRGLRCEVLMSSAGPIFLDRASTEQRRGLMEFVQTDFKRQALLSGIVVEPRAFRLGELGEALDRGLVALVLIDQQPMMGYTCPHWVLVHGHGEGIYFLNDPWIEPDRLEHAMDVFDLPVTAVEFDRMAWYGSPPYRAAVLVGPSH